MKKSVLLVEDRAFQESELRAEIAAISVDLDVLPPCDSLENVIAKVINANLRPDCAIIDAQIYEAPASPDRNAPQTHWGIEAVRRLIEAGVSPSKVLVLTAFKAAVEAQLRRAGLLDQIRIIEKPLHSNKLRSIISEFCFSP